MKCAMQYAAVEFMPMTTSGNAPFYQTLHINHTTERGQEQEADASAEDGPRRRPNPLYHRANVASNAAPVPA